MIELGIVQITSAFKEKTQRFIDLKEKIIPKCIEISNKRYTLVSPANEELKELCTSLGGEFVEYTAWERDKNRKFREGIKTRQEDWVAFLDDDILPDEEWLDKMSSFLSDKEPGQYGFRLTDSEGQRHEFGEDWMQFYSVKSQLQHRALKYDLETGYLEQSPTAYVSNSVVHNKVYNFVEPYGIFQKAPDVNWCFSIKQAGFPVGFCMHARAYHLGDRGDNR
jgi:glycosyltransferase involved in cell wall biosynthesis